MKLEDNLNDVRLFNFWNANYISFKKDHKGHNVNGPAWINSAGYKEYSINGRYHNTRGPAVIWGDERESCYLNEKRCD